MDLDLTIATFVEAILAVAIPVVAGFVLALIKTLSSHIKSKTDNDLIYRYVNIAEQAISDTVIALNETVVKEIKAETDGKLTKESGQKILVSAIDSILSTLSDEAKAVLSIAYGDLGEWIRNKIEVHVKNEKLNSAMNALPQEEEPLDTDEMAFVNALASYMQERDEIAFQEKEEIDDGEGIALDKEIED